MTRKLKVLEKKNNSFLYLWTLKKKKKNTHFFFKGPLSPSAGCPTPGSALPRPRQMHVGQRRWDRLGIPRPSSHPSPSALLGLPLFFLGGGEEAPK